MRARSGKTVLRKRARLRRLTKGCRAGRHRLYRQSAVALLRARAYAYRDRRAKKREFRSLWIVRINAACREQGISYSQFMGKLNNSSLEINRKVLADLALNDPAGFKAVFDQIMNG